MEKPDVSSICGIVDISYMSRFNQIYGWAAGNALLRKVSDIFCDLMTNSLINGFYQQGDEFIFWRFQSTVGEFIAIYQEIEQRRLEIHKELSFRFLCCECNYTDIANKQAVRYLQAKI